MWGNFEWPSNEPKVELRAHSCSGLGTHGLWSRVSIYATYDDCGSVYRLNTGGGAAKYGKGGWNPIPLSFCMLAAEWSSATRCEAAAAGTPK